MMLTAAVQCSQAHLSSPSLHERETPPLPPLHVCTCVSVLGFQRERGQSRRGGALLLCCPICDEDHSQERGRECVVCKRERESVCVSLCLWRLCHQHEWTYSKHGNVLGQWQTVPLGDCQGRQFCVCPFLLCMFLVKHTRHTGSDNTSTHTHTHTHTHTSCAHAVPLTK